MYLQPIKFIFNRSRKDGASNQVDSEALKLHQNETKVLSMAKLFQESGNDISLPGGE